MDKLALPEFQVRLSEKDGKTFIFDKVRKKHVALTPEEWVRQHFVNYLITAKHYPIETISNEVAIKLHNTSKRCDTVIFNTMLEPFIIAEYKAPHIEIHEH